VPVPPGNPPSFCLFRSPGRVLFVQRLMRVPFRAALFRDFPPSASFSFGRSRCDGIGRVVVWVPFLMPVSFPRIKFSLPHPAGVCEDKYSVILRPLGTFSHVLGIPPRSSERPVVHWRPGSATDGGRRFIRVPLAGSRDWCLCCVSHLPSLSSPQLPAPTF